MNLTLLFHRSIAPSVYPGDMIALVPEAGLKTTSWHFPAQEGKGTILFFHGNNGHIETRTGWMQFALAQGWGLFMVGYQGPVAIQACPARQA